MPRNRVIYQSEALYVGPSPAYSGHYKFVTGSNAVNVPTQKLNQLDPLSNRIVNSGNTTGALSSIVMTSGLLANVTNLDRIQSINYNFNIPRTDVNQFGNLAAIDRVIIDQPTVGLDFNYLQNGFKNEKELGFSVNILKRPALVDVNFVTAGSSFGIGSISVVDGGQGYLRPFSITYQGGNAGVLNVGVATEGPYLGQVTGIIIENPGELNYKVNGVSLVTPGIINSIDLVAGIRNADDSATFSPSINNILPEATGLVYNTSCISGILTKASDDKNYFIRTVSAGNDVSIATTGTLDQSIIAIGNGVITNYTVNGAVGDFPNAAISCEALNMSFLTGANNFKSSAATARYKLPSVDENGAKVNGTFSLPDFNGRTDLSQNISVFKPGEIILDLSRYSASGGFGIDSSSQASLNAQSFSLNIALSRENLRRLGSTYAYSKEITFPISYSLSVDVLVSDLKAGNLINIISGEDIKFDASISYIKPGTKNSSLGAITGARYTIKNTQIESMDFSSSIGANKTATLTFGGQMSSAQDTSKGILMHGDYWLQIPEVL
jgi:hypothetical protein